MCSLMQFDPISGMLAVEILLDCKTASEMYKGLVCTDVLLGHIHIYKFLSEVVYEGLNIFRVALRTTECVITKIHKTHYCNAENMGI